MNPSTAFARVLVDELVRCGVREAVLSPGSRSAPLAFALHDADARGDLRLHVRIDERSAGFLALGLAKASGLPVPVVTTSGTATANLHPAVMEAAHSSVPLLVLTADRPPELRGVGANQTTDQVKLYGGLVREFVEVGVPEARVGQVAYWRSLAARSVAAARSGPVHLNLPLREPLVPDDDDTWVESLAGRVDGRPWVARERERAVARQREQALPARGVVVLGDGAGAHIADSVELARCAGWPVIAEPTAWSGDLREHVDGYPLVLSGERFAEGHRPDMVVVVGRPTLSRDVVRLLRAAREHWVVDPLGRWADPARTATRLLTAVPEIADGRDPGDTSWADTWQAAGRAARACVDHVLADVPLSEPRVARDVVAAVPAGALLFVGSSRPIRDVDAYALARTDITVHANRGVAGIDGTVSSAIGAALAHDGPSYALVGDLTFLHDANGLVLGPDEPRPDLCLVVVNNDGGGIFGMLEQGGPEHTAAFERVFGTPHGVDLAALCAATGTPHVGAAAVDELRDALSPTAGVRVVEVRTDRDATRDVHRRIRSAVAKAMGRP